MARPFLLRTRWLAGHFLIIATVLLFLACMQWQLHRLDARKAHNRQTYAAMHAPPILTAPPTGAPDWQHVSLTGTWDSTSTQLVRYPLRNGQTGYEVVTPIALEDGSKMPVNRGWIALEDGKAMTLSGSAPTGTVTVDGWFRHASGNVAKPGTNGTGVPTITKMTSPYVQALPGSSPGDITINGHTVLPLPREAPDLGTGPHFAYALQWLSFSLIAVLGWVALLSKAWREERQAGTVS